MGRFLHAVSSECAAKRRIGYYVVIFNAQYAQWAELMRDRTDGSLFEGFRGRVVTCIANPL